MKYRIPLSLQITRLENRIKETNNKILELKKKNLLSFGDFIEMTTEHKTLVSEIDYFQKQKDDLKDQQNRLEKRVNKQRQSRFINK